MNADTVILDTKLKADIETTQANPKKDAACKKLLSHKVFLAWILKSCLAEYRDYPIKDIIEKYIEGEPWINAVPVDADETNPALTKTNPVIKGGRNEDTSQNEGKAIYDIMFYAIKPGTFNKDNERIRLIINIEPQYDWNLPYPLLSRAVYYTSRMISSQKGRDFVDMEYDKVLKVASIWVCTNTPKNVQNNINYYEMNEHHLLGNLTMPRNGYDLQTIALICLGEPNEDNAGTLLELLEILLSAKLEVDDKEKLLKDKFDIAMTDEMKEEAQIMGSYGLGMLEQGKREGIDIGIEKGIEKGKTEERLANIQSLITKLSFSAEKAMDTLNIPQEERSQYLPKLKHLN